MAYVQILFIDFDGHEIGLTPHFEENTNWLIPENAKVMRVRIIDPGTKPFAIPGVTEVERAGDAEAERGWPGA
jgi:hypothetical protein